MHWRAHALAAALLGWVAGTAVQLHQPRLWAAQAYAALALAALFAVLLAVLLWAWQAFQGRRRAVAGWLQAALALACAACLAFAQAGWRAAQRVPPPPDWQGRDVRITATVADMPQRTATGWRLVLDVEQAHWADGREGAPPLPLPSPARVRLGWFAGADFGADAGEAAPGAVAVEATAEAADPKAAPAQAGANPPARRLSPAGEQKPALRAIPQPALQPVLQAGQRWRLTARLGAPHGLANPHGFDEELWLWSQDIAATGYVRTGARVAAPVLLGQGGGWNARLHGLRQRVRDAILQQRLHGVDAALSARLAGVVAALVTGDQRAIAPQDWDTFRTTGVAHLMSISGLHITLFAWLAVAVLGRAWRGMARWRWPAGCNPCLLLPAPVAGLGAGVALAAGYALFSGWGVPAQRTVLMLAAMALVRFCGLRWPWWLGWLLAAAAVLAWQPWALLQAGFWLSFVAVGVLFASGPQAPPPVQAGAAGACGGACGGVLDGVGGGDAGHRRSGHGRMAWAAWLAWAVSGVRRARAALGGAWRQQWVVTLALTPLTLLVFGQASAVGLAANALAIGWVTLLVTPLGLLGLLGMACPALGGFFWQAAAWALLPLAAWLQWLAQWPFASVALPAVPLAVAACALAGGVWLAMPWPWRLRLLALPLLLPLALWRPSAPGHGQFELLAADVGQGSAVLVRTARHALLYDAGPPYGRQGDAGERVLLPLMRALGVRPDVLLISHGDVDHTGGARAVLAAHPQAALLSSIDDGHALQGVRRAMRCQAGQSWQWDGVRLDVLHPAAGDYGGALDDNAMSCVLRIASADGRAALLAGDIPAAQERRLLQRHGAQALRADVLLVPHHGSRSSASPAFVRAVQPRWALVQAGWQNRFGHPAAVVRQRLSANGATVADTAHCGAMRWQSEQPDALHCQRRQRLRYWHWRQQG